MGHNRNACVVAPPPGFSYLPFLVFFLHFPGINVDVLTLVFTIVNILVFLVSTCLSQLFSGDC